MINPKWATASSVNVNIITFIFHMIPKYYLSGLSEYEKTKIFNRRKCRGSHQESKQRDILHILSSRENKDWNIFYVSQILKEEEEHEEDKSLAPIIIVHLEIFLPQTSVPFQPISHTYNKMEITF